MGCLIKVLSCDYVTINCTVCNITAKGYMLKRVFHTYVCKKEKNKQTYGNR